MKKASTIFLVLLLSGLLAGCGNVFEGMEDTDTEEAQVIEVNQRLNSGENEWVLDECKAGADISSIDCAAAAIGQVGIDATTLIDALTDTVDAGITNDVGAVAEIPLVITSTTLADLDSSKTWLEEELQDNPTDPDLNFQMVMLSTVDTIAVVANAIDANSLGDSSDGIDSDEASALSAFLSDPANSSLADAIAANVSDNINAATDALPYSDLSPDSGIGELLYGITNGTGGLDADQDGSIDSAELINYLNTGFGQ